MAIIEVNQVSKHYPVQRRSKVFLGRGGLMDFVRGRKPDTFAALSDISLSVEPGESVGLIGRNGSGKSTLLKLLAGVTLPSEGTIRVGGRVASLLELGAGFHPMLTGRENVYLNAGILGMRHSEVDQVFDSIVDFSGIGAFIEQTVDTYSSGMYVRIAFSVAVHVNPDIFLVDEVLAVGDEDFQRKCRTKIGELREQGKTIVFVSHDLGIVHALCNRVCLLNGGKMISRNTAQATIDYYLRQIGQDTSLHTLANDEAEVIFSNGRISVFKDEKELTTAGAITFQMMSMGAYHESAAAVWKVTERTETSCTATGLLPRLPVTLHCRLWLTGSQVNMTLSWTQDQELSLDTISANAFFHSGFTEWRYSAESGTFPKILPSDQIWTSATPAETGCYSTMIWGQESAPLQVAWSECPSGSVLQLFSSDYMTSARIAHFTRRVPSADNPLPAGTYPIGTLSLETGLKHEDLQRQALVSEKLQTLPMPLGEAVFRTGAIHVGAGGAWLSRIPHLHTQIFLAGIWNWSQLLRWSPAEKTDRGVRRLGESPRFPYAQEWELWEENGACHWQCWLHAHETLLIPEYNISLGLAAGYDRWETDGEGGHFPPFHDDNDGWLHVNKDYATGTTLRAYGAGLPTVTLTMDPEAGSFHPTALNTGANQGARVLQFIRLPQKQSHLEFKPGRHLLCNCVLTLTPGS